jgi:hypothetical protein
MNNTVSDAKNEEVKELLKESTLVDSSVIQDNKLQFKVGEDIFRVKMPTQKELANAEDKRYKTWIRMLQEEDTIPKKKLIALLKEKQNIDIEELEKQKKLSEKKLHEAYLGLAVCRDGEQEKIQGYIKKIEDIRSNYIDTFLEIEQYLAPAIENRIEGLYSKYLTVSCTDKLNSITNEWEKVWKSYSDFEADNSPIAIQACLHFGYLFKFNRGY